MARDFNGSSDYATAGDAPKPLTAISISAWVFADALAADNAIVSKPFTEAGWSSPFIQYRMDATTKPRMLVNSGGSAFAATGATNFPTGAWTHIGGGYTASTGPISVYLNGVSDGTQAFTGNIQYTNATNLTIGQRGSTSPGEYVDGRIAEVGIWDVELTAAEMATLGKGYSPLFIHPENLLGYWPLIGRTSPEIELIAANGATLTGTAAGSHPRIIYPRPVMKAKSAAGVAAPTLRAQIWM